jgi:hypothetical protein
MLGKRTLQRAARRSGIAGRLRAKARSRNRQSRGSASLKRLSSRQTHLCAEFMRKGSAEGALFQAEIIGALGSIYRHQG